ncbi:MAG: DNA polymerase III subunit chi [Pseudomonas sp.]|uniref:DNA polymerase III subunit chi n=1 Tax=Pseudomonas abieticivorans TaxID=2931382 RepID=UPI0020BDF373|nr:DNA polymerase III subunit chi [Pseudomonas sp. PIA16]MDE1165145.1 DNA polymerase III subunit chi [Pseudomonas sp.]
MDNPNSLPKSAHLLDDLESIRKLLGDDTLQPPLLTDTVGGEEQIPLLFDQLQEPKAQTPAPTPPPAPKPAVAATPAENRQDTLLHLDRELRAAAQLIMQDVIDDFAPHIETEIKRRLEARMERLLNQQ